MSQRLVVSVSKDTLFKVRVQHSVREEWVVREMVEGVIEGDEERESGRE